MPSTLEIIIFFLPILLAVVAGAATFSLIFEKSTSGVRTAASLLILSILSLLMFVFTVSYLIGPDCVFCYQPRKLRLAGEYFIVVVIYGLVDLSLVWWVGRAKKVEMP
jgi:hypothetical protein